MSAHLDRHHSEIKPEEAKQLAAADQRTLDGTVNSSDSARQITASVTRFICNDLHLYSVVENCRLGNILYNLEVLFFEFRYIVKEVFSFAFFCSFFKSTMKWCRKSEKSWVSLNESLLPATHGPSLDTKSFVNHRNPLHHIIFPRFPEKSHPQVSFWV